MKKVVVVMILLVLAAFDASPVSSSWAMQAPGPVIDNVSPNVVSNTGLVEITFHGSNLSTDTVAYMSLEWNYAINGDPPGCCASYEAGGPTFAEDGAWVRGTFDLNDAIPGTYDLRVQIPCLYYATLPGALTIVNGDPANTVYSIWPRKAAGQNRVKVTVYGAGFVNGTGVKLVRDDEEIVASVLFKDANTLETTFDFVGKQAGTWDLLVTRPDGTISSLDDAFTLEPGDFLIHKVSPTTGGKDGLVTLRLRAGAAVSDVSAVQLIKEEAVIQAFPVRTSNTSSWVTIDAAFDLTDASVGAYDIKILCSDGRTGIQEDAFLVVENGEPQVSVSVYGRLQIRTATDTVYTVILSNTGYQDAVGIPALVVTGAVPTWSIDLTKVTPFAMDPEDSVQEERDTVNNTGTILLFPTTRVPAKREVIIPVTLSFPVSETETEFQLQARWY